MGEFEAIGEAVTGGMAGRAVEPNAGEPGADGHTHERNCLNCGTPLSGDYCHACGQKAHIHRTLSAFFHDFLHGVLHFEGKIWNMLPMLAWKPGELTRRYIDGERARYVSPVALFLFSVFLMFAVGSLTGGISTSVVSPEAQAELSREVAKEESEIARLRQQRAEAVRQGRSPRAIDTEIEAKTYEIGVLKGMPTDVAQTGATVELDGAPDWLRAPIEKARKNPELLFYKLKTNAYKFSWALIPLSLPFMWLLFPFSKQFRLYDHTVFVTYSLSFMTALAVTGMILGTLGLSSFAGLLFLIPPIHMYRQLKGAYGLTKLSAVVRTLVLLIFSLTALTLFGLALLGLGLFD